MDNFGRSGHLISGSPVVFKPNSATMIDWVFTFDWTATFCRVSSGDALHISRLKRPSKKGRYHFFQGFDRMSRYIMVYCHFFIPCFGRSSLFEGSNFHCETRSKPPDFSGCHAFQWPGRNQAMALWSSGVQLFMQWRDVPSGKLTYITMENHNV